MGAGDAKLVMALSTVLGSAQTLDLIYGSFLVGSLGAIVLLIRKKRVRIFFREVFNFFKTLFIKDLKIIWPKLDRETKAPFAVAICMGYFYVWSKSRFNRDSKTFTTKFFSFTRQYRYATVNYFYRPNKLWLNKI
jgi:Flp pilus assembly protein protease CpaA